VRVIIFLTEHFAEDATTVAFDPLDGNLWISRLTIFTGDDKIWKIVPPQATPTPGTCPVVTSLTVHDHAGNLRLALVHLTWTKDPSTSGLPATYPFSRAAC
jgi:hypothetical protein